MVEPVEQLLAEFLIGHPTPDDLRGRTRLLVLQVHAVLQHRLPLLLPAGSRNRARMATGDRACRPALAGGERACRAGLAVVWLPASR